MVPGTLGASPRKWPLTSRIRGAMPPLRRRYSRCYVCFVKHRDKSAAIAVTCWQLGTLHSMAQCLPSVSLSLCACVCVCLCCECHVSCVYVVCRVLCGAVYGKCYVWSPYQCSLHMQTGSLVTKILILFLFTIPFLFLPLSFLFLPLFPPPSICLSVCRSVPTPPFPSPPLPSSIPSTYAPSI